MSDGVLASRGYVGRESSGIHAAKLADKTRRLGEKVNENVNYHPLRRCVICNESVEADARHARSAANRLAVTTLTTWVAANGIAPTATTEKLTRARTVVRHPIGGARIAANGFAKTIRHSSRFKVRNSILFSATTAIMIYVGN